MLNFTSSSEFSQTQRLEMLKEANKLLTTATKAAGSPIGVEPVISILQFSGVYEASITIEASTFGEILNEVETAGIELTPGLERLVNSSSPQNVMNALTSYIEVYGKGGGNNPAKLFYRILQNENRRRSQVQV